MIGNVVDTLQMHQNYGRSPKINQNISDERVDDETRDENKLKINWDIPGVMIFKERQLPEDQQCL